MWHHVMSNISRLRQAAVAIWPIWPSEDTQTRCRCNMEVPANLSSQPYGFAYIEVARLAPDGLPSPS